MAVLGHDAQVKSECTVTFFSQNAMCEKFGVICPLWAISARRAGMSKANGLKTTAGARYSLTSVPSGTLLPERNSHAGDVGGDVVREGA